MQDFFAQVIGTYLAELTGNAAEKVGKTLADLWRKRAAPPSAAQAELPAPFNSPPLSPSPRRLSLGAKPNSSKSSNSCAIRASSRSPG
jgi:hypothetical protein